MQAWATPATCAAQASAQSAVAGVVRDHRCVPPPGKRLPALRESVGPGIYAKQLTVAQADPYPPLRGMRRDRQEAARADQPPCIVPALHGPGSGGEVTLDEATLRLAVGAIAQSDQLTRALIDGDLVHVLVARLAMLGILVIAQDVLTHAVQEHPAE